MNWLRLIRARVVGFFRKEELEGEIDEELRFHVAMRAQENIARGMSPAEAAREARRQFGNVNHIKDEWRDVSGGGGLESFVYDVRFGARMLMKDRAFTIVAVLALALGIGANTALFTVLSNVLLRPLPFRNAEAIMSVAPRHWSIPNGAVSVSYPDFLDLREQTRVFERLGAYRPADFIVRANGGEPAQMPGAWVTSDVFPVLGVKPAVGRTFGRADEDSRRCVAVISHEFWEQQFGKAPNVTGAGLKINGADYSIIGVMPPGFRFPVQNEAAQLWVSLGNELKPLADGAQPSPLRLPSHLQVADRGSHFLRVLARLKPGVTEQEARADVNAIAARLAEQYPDTNRNYATYVVKPWLEAVTRAVRPVLLMLVGAAGFALCVACANVANLLLARASTRRREIALRAALGAGRRRIFRQLLTESLLLASFGGCAGWLLALVGTHYLVAALPADFPRLHEIAPDARVLGFALLVTLTTSCLFGVAPGWRSAKTKLSPLLNDASTGATDTAGGRRARNTLVVVEIVLAFVLLAGACFFIANLMQLRAAPLGFDPRNIVTASLSFPDPGGREGGTRAVQFFDELLQRVSRLDDVESASLVSRLPLSGAGSMTDFAIAGRPMSPADQPLAEPHMAVPGYFATMRIPIKRGRDFDGRDGRDSPAVVIINETLAGRYFPGENPVGKRITPWIFPGAPEREIIGVVGDVRTDMLAIEQRTQVYIPLTQSASRDATLVIRTGSTPEALLPEIKAIAADINGDVPVADFGRLDDRVALAIATPRLKSALLTAFAAVAVVLTAIGVYGVMAYSVAQRRYEIGIRLALGAPESVIFRLVLGEGIRLAACGILLGALLAVAMLPALRSLAPQAVDNHGIVIALTALLLGAVALAACWIPARRAARQQPLVALGMQPAMPAARVAPRSTSPRPHRGVYDAPSSSSRAA
ncbi:MAG: Acidobacterial duplicated orphan permease (function unknown) [uncultured Chthoniobacterales bacterium]|uniref:Uncharacterized protein n=1 Tax=uncultured Chthoniobacterales bacterium TaxID=1836801 RepID=A0A6J4IRH0_9BACT|nr:MAG: Acidobacterial duplicated orphan permease (function unknown) [uncultured Chthoniobacterales bacterium]